MHIETLAILRCPFCGGRLELVESAFHRLEGGEIVDAILGCHCCVFPVVAGIPVMHLDPAASAAREEIEAGRPDRAARRMFALDDAAQAARFDEVAAAPTATFRDLAGALGPAFEGGYFLYRFSDPTYVVADAVSRAVASTVLRGAGRAIDVCGGSGHLTRSLLDRSSAAPVLADLYFAKLWLARRFTAPGCEPVCCDGNAPLPFVNGAFSFVVCSDAFHYIWTKRLLAAEMMRLTAADGALVVTHAHNAHQWNPSAGMPLPPDAYRELFDEMAPRVFAEATLLNEIVAGGPLDLSRRHPPEAVDADLAVTIVASRRDAVFRAYALEMPETARGEFRVNPLYDVERDGGGTRLRLRFPSTDYEEEYGAARLYLPDEVPVDEAILARLPADTLPPGLTELARRRVLLDLPKQWSG
jgi:SAM-dependent methyltransferase